MSSLTILSQRNRFGKEALNPKIRLEPWMHIGVIELDNGRLGYAIWVWDSRQVIEEGELSKEQEDKIMFYITDNSITNEPVPNDSYLPLTGGGHISKAISRYFDEQLDILVEGIETAVNMSYEDAIEDLPPKKSKLVQQIKDRSGPHATFNLRCINVKGFKDGVKVRCSGGSTVAKMVNDKLSKAGLRTNLPSNSRDITVYCE